MCNLDAALSSASRAVIFIYLSIDLLRISSLYILLNYLFLGDKSTGLIRPIRSLVTKERKESHSLSQ